MFRLSNNSLELIYMGSVDYSEEDNCLFGKVLGMSKDAITYEGQTIEESGA